MSDWTTKIDPSLLKGYGLDEVHTAHFNPPDGGKGIGVALIIPECEYQLVFLDNKGEPQSIINRPKTRTDVKYWTRFLCDQAKEHKAMVSVICDTAEQVEVAVRRIKRLLPRWERVAQERIIEGQGGRPDHLS